MSRRIRVTLDVEVEAKDRVDAACRVAFRLAEGRGTLWTEEPPGHELDHRGKVAVRVFPLGEWDGREAS